MQSQNPSTDCQHKDVFYVNAKAKKLSLVTEEIVKIYAEGKKSYQDTICLFTRNYISIMMEVTLSDLQNSQEIRACEARAICYYIIKEHCQTSYRSLGKMFGKSAAAVHRSITNLEYYLQKKLYPEYQLYIESINTLINTLIKALYGRAAS